MTHKNSKQNKKLVLGKNNEERDKLLDFQSLHLYMSTSFTSHNCRNIVVQLVEDFFLWEQTKHKLNRAWSGKRYNNEVKQSTLSACPPVSRMEDVIQLLRPPICVNTSTSVRWQVRSAGHVGMQDVMVGVTDRELWWDLLKGSYGRVMVGVTDPDMIRSFRLLSPVI